SRSSQNAREGSVRASSAIPAVCPPRGKRVELAKPCGHAWSALIAGPARSNVRREHPARPEESVFLSRPEALAKSEINAFPLPQSIYRWSIRCASFLVAETSRANRLV